jgi:hypothetical protein
MHRQTATIQFHKAASSSYNDEVVQLSCTDHDELIATLYKTLSPFRPAGVVRPDEEPTPGDGTQTEYEQDYQRVSRRLRNVRWESFDLETAAFLFGYWGCLGQDEIIGMLPFAFEILFRADRYVFPFCYFFRGLREGGIATALAPVFQDEENREIVAAALIALRDKFLGSHLSDLQRYKLEELFADVDEWTELTDW